MLSEREDKSQYEDLYAQVVRYLDYWRIISQSPVKTHTFTPTTPWPGDVLFSTFFLLAKKK